MVFKRCVLKVTFHVSGLDMTYANIWQTSFNGVDIKQWLRRFPEERYACKYNRELACGHFCIQAKVSLHGRCHLIGGTGMLEWRAEIRRVRCSHVCHQGATNQPARCSKSKNADEATVCLQHCLIRQYAVYRAY